MPMFGVKDEQTALSSCQVPPKMSLITAPGHMEKLAAVRHPGTALHAPYRA
jgi:hypothetical protein